ncbi:MAG TPA: response regulator [Bdellovibrionota bacterium]|nr:response regulator [Bdellovibrionota bacterium]
MTDAVKKRILVVDDDLSILDLIRAGLDPAQYEVVGTTKGREGIELVEKERFDLAVVDALLPDLRGDFVTKAIRERYGPDQLPVIVLSAFFRRNRGSKEVLARWQANAFIPKPFAIVQLQKEIDRLLAVESRDSLGSDALQTLRDNYVQNLVRTVGDLHKAMALNLSIPMIRAVCHQIVGSAGSYGYPEISEHAKALEHFSASLHEDFGLSMFEQNRMNLLFDRLERAVGHAKAVTCANSTNPAEETSVICVSADNETRKQLEKEAHNFSFTIRGTPSLDDAVRLVRSQFVHGIIIDLDSVPPNQFGALSTLRSLSQSKKVWIVGFGSNDGTAAQSQAARAGVDRLVSKSAGTRALLNVVRNGIQPKTESAETLLVVDDDREVFRFLKMALASIGFRIEFESNVNAVLERARELKPSSVLMDFEMPGIRGHEICRAFKVDPELCRIPVIIYTSFNDEDHRMRALRAGAVEVLHKGSSIDELKLRLQNLVNLYGMSRAAKPVNATSPSNGALAPRAEAR